MAHGLADNLLTVTYLTARCPVLLAPAMDAGMYTNPATKANLALLEDRGIHLEGPAEGRMASGLTGLGRMVEPDQILGRIRILLGKDGSLRGRNVVVSAGPTHEALDPVRLLSNQSSGKQGYALAQAALDAGADVTLVSGPVQIEAPTGAKVEQVETAMEMCEAVLGEAANADVLLMAAAVSDFRPAAAKSEKMKKNEIPGESLEISLIRNPDILEQVKSQKAKSGKPTITLGFAAESRNLVEYGRSKLDGKGLDFIAINEVGSGPGGFRADENQVILLGADGSRTDLPLQHKATIAEEIIRIVATALEQAAD